MQVVPLFLSQGWLIALLILVGIGALIVLAAGLALNYAASLALKPVIDRLGSIIIVRTGYGESIEYLRELGFFEDYTGSAFGIAEQIVNDIESRRKGQIVVDVGNVIREATGRHDARDRMPWNWYSIANSRASSQPRLIDLLLLSADTNRVWWHDRECVIQGMNGYVQTLLEWSAISRGAFQPVDLAETWWDDIGPVTIDLVLNGERHVFTHANGFDRMLDTTGLRNFINPLIRDSGYQFEICAVRDDPNVVVVLTPAEKLRLETSRGWIFETTSNDGRFLSDPALKPSEVA